MAAQPETLQRIARLTPLADVLRLIETLAQPVPPRQMSLVEAAGLTLADDVVAPSAKPSAALALRDGWAVRADDVADAGTYAPVTLNPTPPWVEAGEPLPAGTDAVAPVDAVILRGVVAEATAPVIVGEDVLVAGADAAADAVLRTAGARLRHTDIAALAALGIDGVTVCRPRVRIAGARPDAILDAIVSLLGAAVAVAGGGVVAEPEFDCEIIVGGTGGGRGDTSVHALAQRGEVLVHGMAIAPGETAALGRADRRPVLLVPGRVDAALAVWLLLGRPLLARLRGGSVEDIGFEVALSRKVASRLGLAEVILVQRTPDGVAPLASDYLSLNALAAADGWILVPADSEGYPAGTRVTVRALP